MYKHVLMCAAAVVSLTACEAPVDTADQKAAHQQEDIADRAQQEVGIYRPTHFTRKRLANRIGQMLDDPTLATISYAQGIDGRLRCIGHSIGFPLPAATQTTSPQKWEEQPPPDGRARTYSTALVPQAEPDQLFSPGSADATWILLVSKTGTPQPAYFEGNVETFLESAKPDASLIAQDCAG